MKKRTISITTVFEIISKYMYSLVKKPKKNNNICLVWLKNSVIWWSKEPCCGDKFESGK